MTKTFSYTNTDGLASGLTLSDDTILVLNYEAEFEEPFKTGLTKGELTLPLKLAFSMRVDNSGQKVSFRDWIKGLKFPFKELGRLESFVGEMFGHEEDKEEGEEAKNV